MMTTTRIVDAEATGAESKFDNHEEKILRDLSPEEISPSQASSNSPDEGGWDPATEVKARRK